MEKWSAGSNADITTWIEPEAKQLIGEALDDYPQTAEIERRCVNMLAHLWHTPDEEAVGT